jgi:hypothetical protein
MGFVDVKPKTRDEAQRCIEAIELFGRCENALGLRAMALRDAPRFADIDIEGVAVSIQPDCMVDGPNGHIGAGMIRVAKAPDPDAVGWMRRAEGGATIVVRWLGTWSRFCKCFWKRKAGQKAYQIEISASLLTFG